MHKCIIHVQPCRIKHSVHATRRSVWDKPLPTCHVMVSMAFTNQRHPHKGWNTSYAPDGEWTYAFLARLVGQEKCSCPLFKRAGNADQERLFAHFFLEMAILARPMFDLQFSDEYMSIKHHQKRGLRQWTRLLWPCSIRKKYHTPLVEPRRSGLAVQRSLRREATWMQLRKIGKKDLHGHVVVKCLMWSCAVAGQISWPVRSLHQLSSEA